MMTLKHSDNRQSGQQRFIYSHLYNVLFAQMKNKVIGTVTHCDGSTPQCIKALQKTGMQMDNIYEFNNTWLWTKNHNQFSNQQWKMATGMWKKFITFMKQNPSDGVNKEGQVPDNNYLMSYQDRAFKDAFKLIVALSEQCNAIIDTKFNEHEINSQQ